MNFKRFHESKNLFDPNSTRYHMGKGSNNRIGSVANGAMFYIEAAPNTNYTIRIHTTDSTFVRLYLSNAPIVENVAESYNVISESETTINPEVTISNTNYTYLWIQVGGTWYTEHGGSSVMLNAGSTPQPYEPYSSEVWHDTPHYIHNTSTDTITTPAVLYPNDTTATVGLKGNMNQTGTPTPDNPVMPQECGERTGNVIDYTQSESGGIDGNGNYVTASNLWRSTVFIPIDSLQYFISWTEVTSFIAARINYYTSEKSHISREQITTTGTALTIPQNAAYFKWTLYATAGTVINLSYVADLHIMLNSGSTALPYEPYGIKIPISSANTTTPVYLGEVETTRKIGKIDLSEVSWTQITSGLWKTTNIPNIKYVSVNTELGNGIAEKYTIHTGSGMSTALNCIAIDVSQVSVNTGTSEKPTGMFWYVLATETTGIVNEPIRKIGDYADEVSGITIPTIAGGDTISVGTTLQPSEITVNYKGWHPVADVHERESGQWD